MPLLADTFPAEIRLKIYGYLLLDPPRVSLAPIKCAYTAQRHSDGTVKHGRLEDEDMGSNGMGYDGFSTDYYSDSDPDESMFDFGGFGPYGIPMGDMCDGMFNEVYSLGGGMDFEDDMFDYMGDPRHETRSLGKQVPAKGEFEKEPKTKRHLAILRTNRQIYDEASYLLNSDLTVMVEPGDALTDVPGNDIVKQTKKLWRHDPAKGLGFTNINGQTVYKTSALDGSVEPHIFARFENVSYNAQFDFEFHDAAPSLYIDDDLNVGAENAAEFVSYLTTAKSTTRWFEDPITGRSFDNGRRETVKDVADITISSITITQPSTADIITKFVDLLSNSPFIRHLEFILNVEVGHEDNLSLDLEDETDSEQDSMDDVKMYVSNERATELFLESGALYPLRNLSNVRCFSLQVTSIGREFEVMKLQRKHLDIIHDLKEVIEKNWVVQNAPH